MADAASSSSSSPRKQNNNNNTTTKNPPSRKRSRSKRDEATREKLQQYGVDLPDIPGLPVEVIPLQVHALKQVVASVKHDATRQPLVPWANEEQNQNENSADSHNPLTTGTTGSSARHSSAPSSSLVARLVDRVEQATTTTTNTNTGGTSVSLAEQVHHQQQVRMRQDQRRESVQAWLTALHRQVRNGKKHKQHTTKDDDSQPPKDNDPQSRIPIAALTPLWTAAIYHGRIAVRRSTLFLAGHLLQKSCAARQWLFQAPHEEEDGHAPPLRGPSSSSGSEPTVTNPLVEWLDALIAVGGRRQQAHEDRSNPRRQNQPQQQPQPQQERLWQREGYLWLYTLAISKGFGTLYPRLTVALQKLEQSCPWVVAAGADDSIVSSSPTTTTPMNIMWRTWRDWAMQHYRHEHQRVSKLLQHVSKCLEILVPRVEHGSDGGVESLIQTLKPTEPNEKEDHGPKHASSTSNDTDETIARSSKEEDDTKRSPEHDLEDDDDDEDDWDDAIDWEDGWEENNQDKKDDAGGDGMRSAVAHRASVERTMAAMQATAPMKEQVLIIDMNQGNGTMLSKPNDQPQQQDQKKEEKRYETARNRLMQCRTLLHTRHLPRLVRWIDGLTKADGLVQEETNGSWVQQTQDSWKQERVRALATCMELKSLVTSTLSSLERLGLEQHDEEDTTVVPNKTEPHEDLQHSSMVTRTTTTTTTTTTLGGRGRGLSLLLSSSQKTGRTIQTKPKTKNPRKRPQIRYSSNK